MQEPTLFQRKQQMPPQEDFSSQAGNMNSRLKMLEERHSTLQRKVQLIDQNMLQNNKDLKADIQALNSEITEIRSELSNLTDSINRIVREIQRYAKKEDVDVLKKYLEFWEPVNFTTVEQVEKIVGEAVKEKE